MSSRPPGRRLGVGQPLFYRPALRLFGQTIAVHLLIFVILWAVATLAFIGRYDDSRLTFIPLYFVAAHVRVGRLRLTESREITLDRRQNTGLLHFSAFCRNAHIFFEV